MMASSGAGYTVAKETLRLLAGSHIRGFAFLGIAGVTRKGMGIDGSLTLTVSGFKKITRVVIKINAKDYYDVEFWNCRTMRVDPYLINEKLSEKKDIGWEDLADVIFKELEA